MKRKVNFQTAATIELDIISESNGDSDAISPLSADGKVMVGLLDPNPQLMFNFNDLSSIQDLEEKPVSKFEPVVPGPACLGSILASEYIIDELLNKVAKDERKKEAHGRRRAMRLAIAVSWVTAASSNWVSEANLRAPPQWWTLCHKQTLTTNLFSVVADEWQASEARSHFRLHAKGSRRGR